ncbi:hypothetical protein [Escherichia phage HH3]
MKTLIKNLIIPAACLLMTACGNGLNTGVPNSGVIPHPIERHEDGSLVYDTEKLPYTGQWCQEISHEHRRIGSPSNCVIDY